MRCRREATARAPLDWGDAMTTSAGLNLSCDHARTRRWCRLLTNAATALVLALVAVATTGGGTRAQSQDPARAFILGPDAGRRTVRLAQWGGPRGPAPQGSRNQAPASPFDFFAALFGAAPRRDVHNARPNVLITPDRFGEAVADETPRGGSFGYCVRSCDGRYFPLGARLRGTDDGGAAAYCAAQCPGARMEVFSTAGPASGIDTAVDRMGRAYSERPNAFVYRSRLVEGCTCTASAQASARERISGLKTLSIKDDPSLEKGDIVMTQEGARVFSGRRKGPPFTAEDFVRPGKMPDLPKGLRQRLEELEVAAR